MNATQSTDKRQSNVSQPFHCLIVFFSALVVSTAVSATNLEEIYNLAVENDPQLGAAEAVFLSRNEVVTQSRALLLPNVRVQGTTSDVRRTLPSNPGTPTARFNDHAWQAILTQPVFRLDSWYQFQLSKDQQAEAIANFAAEQQALIVRVTENYFSILERQASLSASNAERDAVQRQLEQVQQRFDVGLVAITDVLEAQAAYDSSTVTVIEGEGSQSSSFDPLLRLTGQSIEQIHGLTDAFPIKYPDPQDEDAWVETALEHNYTVIAARERLQSAEKGLQIAKSAHYPTVDAQATWAHSVNGSVSLFGNKVDQRSLALNMNIPVYQGGRTQSLVQSSVYDLEAAQQQLELAQRQAVENTRTYYKAINTDVARVRARLRGIESSQSALDATQTGYEVGTRNIVDVLLAQQRLYLSQFQYASARYQYVRDTMRLKQSVGTLNADDLYDLNKFIDTNKVVPRTIPTTR